MPNKNKNKKDNQESIQTQKPKLEPKNINRTINGIFELNKKKPNS